jgi:chemotaxis protein MotB
MNPEGIVQINKLAGALQDVGREIPPEINWVLRVDGHTDARPIQTEQFPSNWELSAARAISVVKQLISQGVPPKRLVAAGFGEFQPLDTGDSEEAFTRNRRIELKLTEK